jgi:hypothetical protein
MRNRASRSGPQLHILSIPNGKDGPACRGYPDSFSLTNCIINGIDLGYSEFPVFQKDIASPFRGTECALFIEIRLALWAALQLQMASAHPATMSNQDLCATVNERSGNGLRNVTNIPGSSDVS